MHENLNYNSHDTERKQLASRGSIIKGAVRALGVSLTTFAKEMGISTGFLSKCLNAHGKLDLEVIGQKLDEAETILRKLKVSILVGEEEVGIFIPKRQLSLNDKTFELEMTDRNHRRRATDLPETP